MRLFATQSQYADRLADAVRRPFFSIIACDYDHSQYMIVVYVLHFNFSKYVIGESILYGLC